MTQEQVKQKIAELVTKYESLSQSEVKGYNEAATKLGFIEPMFRALGWDFEDKNEVAPEDKVSNGRVDYAFKLKGVSQFYLEAKPLKADLTNPEYIKQAVTYAYNKGVTWVVLTDFRELRLFNAQTGKPFITLAHNNYTSNFDKLWLLSRESLENSLLNKEAAQYGALPPSLPIETRLYKQLRQWREELFNQIHGHNKELNPNQIDEVVQRFFDRLIFIRTCEDRNLEDKRLLAAANQWKSAGYKGELVEELRQIFKSYWDIYDSELFDKHLTDNVFIEGSTIEKILSGLYEIPGSLASYNFNDIDADVLGAVYEQYLGYVATKVKERVEAQLKLGITDEETFEIISKKQRRKEQGIYYTPKFVTDYIVKETVGRFIKEHSYNEIRNIKILDPACGSGSFLIRAYDELLNYHARERSKSLSELDQKDRLPVLLTNIYGVDLDMQAVEITRLNLLLRTLTEKGKLPYLSNNIRQGNSLISGTEEELRGYFGDSWRDKKPFNWEQEFKDIMAQGGFDVVIGNPPYVGFQGFKDKDYLKDTFETAKGRFDIYIPFIELGLQILKTGGLLSFICPTNFMKRGHGEALRKFCKSKVSILEIVDFRDFQIFEEALNYTGILVLKKDPPEKGHKLIYKAESISAPPQEFLQADLDDELWVFPSLAASKVISAIKNKPVEPLEGLCFGISEGIVTGKNEVFITSIDNAQKFGLEERMFHPILQGKDIRRYFLEKPEHAVIYLYKPDNGETIPIEEKELKQGYPNTWNYLNSKKTNLSGRAYFEASKKLWYELWCERNFETQASEKIVVAEIAEANRFALCPASIFYLDTACGITLRPNSQPRYILGILNSKLMNFFYKNTTVPKANKFFIYKTMFLKHIPIRRIDFSNPKDKKRHDALVVLVDRMLELNRQLAPIRNEPYSGRDELIKEIKKTDKEIDSLVYDLYGLNDEERKIVEGQST